MTSRIRNLRNNSLSATNTLSAERAMLVTGFYKSIAGQNIPVPIQRAMAFKHIIENKGICILPDEIIVGERGPKPKAAPTYPEISLHSLEDLDMLHKRPKVSFKVDKETKTAYHEVIIPFWKGKTQRDRVFGAMTTEWKDAYAAGVFTEFQEQRAPGHTVAGKKLFGKGMKDMKDEIDLATAKLDFVNDPEALSKQHELRAMEIVADSIVAFANRHADALEKLASEEKDENRLNELLEMIRICRRVPENAPQTFHEALQHY
jgi:trans-4-hydroxy-L-proline dehydratase